MPSMKRLAQAVSAAALMLAVGATPALAGSWHQTPVPKSVDTQLSVSCWSSSGCLSVGSGAMRWNGTACSAIAKPTGTVESVACTSSTYCLAVGENTSSRAAAWKWNGSSWKTLAAYNPGSTVNILFAIRCASASSCEAVGTHGNGSNSGTWPLAEHWNGRSWSHQSTTGAPRHHRRCRSPMARGASQ